MLLPLVAVLAATPRIEDYVQKDLKDATFVAQKVKASQKELGKINDDFGMSYRFDSIKFSYKEPFMLRAEARVDDTSALYINNGTFQAFRVPRLKVNSKQDLTNRPGRRQTPVDFGVLTPCLFKGLYLSKFVRMDRATGFPVFDLTFDSTHDSSRQRVWVDPAKGITVKREWYNQQDRLLATFFYEEPQEIAGVWIPKRLTVRNADDKVAGISEYASVKVNQGLPDSLFQL
jgi:outer membrane lipoprotein-sorting protein